MHAHEVVSKGATTGESRPRLKDTARESKQDKARKRVRFREKERKRARAKYRRGRGTERK